MISDLQKNQLSMVEKQGSLQARYYYYKIYTGQTLSEIVLFYFLFHSLCGKIGLTYEKVSFCNNDWHQ